MSQKSKLTTDDFIRRAREVHGDRYNYSKSKYVNINKNLTIICSVHGEFEQTPHNHLSGKGCKLCGIKRRSNKQRKTIEQFIIDARKVHGDRYDYSKSKYVNADTKLTIICSIHGKFKQRPADHLRGRGCRKCKYCKLRNTKLLTIDEFIRKARKIHGDRYDYSKVEYVNSHTNVIIICPEHGEFTITPNKHLGGRRCTYCSGRKTYNPHSYDELKKIIHQLKLKNRNEYEVWWFKNKEYCRRIGIPKFPKSYYKTHK